MIMFVVATCLSGYMIHNSYIKWDEKPVIVSLSEKATPIWKIPFPAVTICPEAKISAKVVNITQTFHELLPNEEISQMIGIRSNFDFDFEISSESMFDEVPKEK